MTKTEDTAICAGCCCGCLFIVAGWASGIAFSVFGILALIHERNSEFRTACKGITIWPALVVQVAMTISGLYKTTTLKSETKPRKSDSIDLVPLAVHLVTYGAVGGWGLYEAYTQCVKDHFNDSEVRLMVMIWSYVAVGTVGLVIVALVAMCVVPECLAKRFTSQKKPKARIRSLDEGGTTALDIAPEQEVSGENNSPATDYAKAPV